MAETSSLLNCRTGNRTTSSNLVASAVGVAETYDGAIAQLVEQRTENPCVPGSIPGGTTKKKRGIPTQQRVILLFFVFPLSSFFLIYEYVLHGFCTRASSTLIEYRATAYRSDALYYVWPPESRGWGWAPLC